MADTRQHFKLATTGHLKNGGMVHDDEAEDRKLIKKVVKKEALTGKKKGGAVKKCMGGKVGR